MHKFLITALLATAATALPMSAAQARTHGHVAAGHTASGVGVVHARSVTREPGAVSAHRTTQTSNGRGITTDRTASHGDGAYQCAVTHTTNNGKTFGRSTSATGNGDGTADATMTRTRADGTTRTVSGTITRKK